MRVQQEISDVECLLAMMMTPGIGVVTLNRLLLALREAGIPLHAVTGSSESVLTKGLPAGLEWAVQPLACCESATVERATFLHQRVLDTGGQWVVRGNSAYPISLLGPMQYHAPPVLTVYGDAELLSEPGVAVVGAREASEHGLTLTRTLATWAAEQKRSVISGGASGVDLEAHRTALEAGGTTCFMIPEGGLRFSGPKWLGAYIESGNAAVVSQFIPDLKWSAAGALTRNRCVAALGEMVCVLDPGREGGSQQTARHALEYGKRTLVYAYDKVNSAYHGLMREGAYPVISETGQWDEPYMEQHWRNRSQSIREQAELF